MMHQTHRLLVTAPICPNRTLPALCITLSGHIALLSSEHQVALQVIGWENIELISDRPLETMLDEFKRLKNEFPDR